MNGQKYIDEVCGNPEGYPDSIPLAKPFYIACSPSFTECKFYSPAIYIERREMETTTLEAFNNYLSDCLTLIREAREAKSDVRCIVLPLDDYKALVRFFQTLYPAKHTFHRDNNSHETFLGIKLETSTLIDKPIVY